MKTFLTMAMAAVVCLSSTQASAQTYSFPDNSQGWVYQGLYDSDSMTPLPDYTSSKNPWTNIDGDRGAIFLGQEGFTVQSPSGASWAHGDLNSPALAYRAGRVVSVSYDITGSHMRSDARVQVQAVMVVRVLGENSDRRVTSQRVDVPIGDDGAWDTNTFAVLVGAGTIVKKISLRIFFHTGEYYEGWIMVDNVVLQ